ncbi:hypothetical protein [Undibacterium sp.]|jgi:hypothetical protein|nr:hypothetical protein [Undibacterium sp.]HTD05067.1 hypothetical protein [Undibacterium sp.]
MLTRCIRSPSRAAGVDIGMHGSSLNPKPAASMANRPLARITLRL